MAEKKDMNPTSPARTPKSQLAAEQPSTGRCWNPPEKDTPHPSQRNPSKVVGAKTGHQRVDRLKPQSQKTNQSDHMDHNLV